MMDDMQVMSAIVRRLDTTQGLVLDELRAVHSLLSRVLHQVRSVDDRVRVLEHQE